MITLKGVWSCFHCGTEYPNQILECANCNASKKHTNNMRRSLGMDAVPEKVIKRSGEEMGKRREVREKYKNNKSKFESIVNKYFRYFFKIKVVKEVKSEKREDSLYYGFDRDGFHYTIRRDKI